MLAAAAVLILVAAGSLLVHARWRAADAALQAFTTRRSQTAVLELPDGSRLMLGPASRLRLAADGSAFRAGTARDVYLEGEAYLEVKHDAARPFRVHTAAGVVEDIGTEFLVSAYPEAPGMRVVVATGAVALCAAALVGSAAGFKVFLAPDRPDIAAIAQRVGNQQDQVGAFASDFVVTWLTATTASAALYWDCLSQRLAAAAPGFCTPLRARFDGHSKSVRGVRGRCSVSSTAPRPSRRRARSSGSARLSRLLCRWRCHTSAGERSDRASGCHSSARACVAETTPPASAREAILTWWPCSVRPAARSNR